MLLDEIVLESPDGFDGKNGQVYVNRRLIRFCVLLNGTILEFLNGLVVLLDGTILEFLDGLVVLLDGTVLESLDGFCGERE